MDLPDALTDRVTHSLRLALDRAQALGDAALAELPLPERHYGMLALLRDGPVAGQHEVGAALGLDRTTTATLVRRLVDRGLVRRRPQPGNGRVLVLELTEAGEAMRAAAAGRLRAGEERFLAPLTPAERVRLRRTLVRLHG
jgi:DNA-binding MarR family transcriptional regulator